MKDQYFGDVNDFQKYTLLRRITRPASLKLGVCWMLTETDGRSDGRHLGYLNQPAMIATAVPRDLNSRRSSETLCSSPGF